MKKIIVMLTVMVMVLGVAGYSSAIPIGDFISFGGGAGDSSLPANDDGSTSEITLTNPFTYFGNTKSSLWVNNNGNITFDGSMNTYTPFAFPSAREIIAPYFGDVDTRGTGSLHYSERTGATDLADASSIINTAFGGSFAASSAFVSTWDAVGYYGSHTDLVNTFQLVLTTDGVDSFAIFNYLDDGMTWETGDASGGSGGFGGTEAAAGFDAGDNTNYYTIAGSFLPGIANVLEDGSNMGVAGQWAFQINDGINPAGDAVPEPATMILFGTGLIGLTGMGRRKFSKNS